MSSAFSMNRSPGKKLIFSVTNKSASQSHEPQSLVCFEKYQKLVIFLLLGTGSAKQGGLAEPYPYVLSILGKSVFFFINNGSDRF
ncbi:Uncharacterized protein dnm_057150 [Desulfonema magnum]|uniref:Uncharacterized protein n=1 Tax=Desulfonema magnum TaxID=45655 RepID=A0A975BQR5_9BACT|nr:Uncharacterized protein dnm_057150 [Desulfonema magnum]